MAGAWGESSATIASHCLERIGAVCLKRGIYLRQEGEETQFGKLIVDGPVLRQQTGRDTYMYSICSPLSGLHWSLLVLLFD